ncbi:hypothetical protein [Limobrevibacterium gyesilva]|uniref:Uncharacterized protein n=1 Tax=Limobrevibacterium gyesilva TaxID=2991712 RepID=A0AA42CEN6_9PROT|nr:hypothetical protein [Limobrevibacterium gyesilva]MCW3476268.1 hypothetical protein [Limobrevibacterium gyesilva]
MTEGSTEPERLAIYIKSLPGFEKYTQIDGNYGHVGAALADAVLQSNNDYERNVRHRIARIRKMYARETSLQDLKQLLQRITAAEFLDWNGTRKPATFLDLVGLLGREGVNTEDDLRKWLPGEESSTKLREIHFIGPKTVDYLRILVGLPFAAMDRHLLGFLECAGIGKFNYARSQEIVHRAADLLGLDRAHLDHSIWRYMKGGKAAVPGGTRLHLGCARSADRRKSHSAKLFR